MKFLPIYLCALLAFVVGCDSGGGKASVTGKVTADGEKVATGNLTFTPVGGGLQPATAVIKPDGTYTLVGAAAGKNAVAFATGGSAEAITLKPGETAPPPPLAGYNVSNPSVELKAGSNTLDIELSKAAK